MLEKIIKIMESLVYERNFKDNQRYKKACVDDVFPTYELAYYPRDMDGGSPEYWLRYYEKPYDGKTVGVIYCDRFDSVKEMAKVILSMINACKK